MSDDTPISFRQFYEQLYAGEETPPSTAQEVRTILSAFADYRRSLNLVPSPQDRAEGDMLLGRLLYHNGAMDAAECAGSSTRAEQHWNALMDAWKLYIYAVYVGDARRPSLTPRMSAVQRLKLWWRRSHVPLDPPVVMPRRAWSMVWAVDSIHGQMSVVCGDGIQCTENTV